MEKGDFVLHKGDPLFLGFRWYTDPFGTLIADRQIWCCWKQLNMDPLSHKVVQSLLFGNLLSRCMKAESKLSPRISYSSFLQLRRPLQQRGLQNCHEETRPYCKEVCKESVQVFLGSWAICNWSTLHSEQVFAIAKLHVTRSKGGVGPDFDIQAVPRCTGAVSEIFEVECTSEQNLMFNYTLFNFIHLPSFSFFTWKLATISTLASLVNLWECRTDRCRFVLLATKPRRPAQNHGKHWFHSTPRFFPQSYSLIVWQLQ